MPQLLTAADLAARLNVSVKTVYRMVQSGEIGHVKVRGSIRFDENAHIQPFLNGENAVRPNPERPVKLANVGPYQHI